VGLQPDLTLIARCVHGLEWICAEEISRRLPAAEIVGLGRREVTFRLASSDIESDLDTVDDVFLVVGQLDGIGRTRDVPPSVARRLDTLPFEARIADLRDAADGATTDGPGPGTAPGPGSGPPRFDVVASIEGRRTFNRFDLENAVGGALAPRLPGEFLARTADGRPGEADFSVRLFLRGQMLIATVRLGPRPRHRRAYKLDTGAGTLHPPVAAALVRLAGVDRGVLLDPFCGDGTIPIEAARAYPGLLAIGADLDDGRLRHAQDNAARAGVAIRLARVDAGRPAWRAGSIEAVITNPPWSLATDARGALAGSLDRFWRRLPDILGPGGRVCAVADVNLATSEVLVGLGYGVSLATQIRLAGRVSHLVLAAPPGDPAPALLDGLASWRDRAIAEGVVTDTGF
jgi:tRNA (guanine6-N2)-methyltransferase